MQSAKIQLSPQHIALVTNAKWILTKNEILQHIKNAFESLYTWQQSVLQDGKLPGAALESGGKITRGENHLGLPWIVLDHPRCFAKANIFAIRTLFWWGRQFSTTLHVSGHWQQQCAPQLMASFQAFQNEHYRICYSGDEWVHDVSGSAYIPMQQLQTTTFKEILGQAPFIKIAAYTPIENIETAMETLMQQFQFLVDQWN